MPPLQKHEPLFCKANADPSLTLPEASFGAGTMTKETLFSEVFPELNGTISFRSLDLKNDLPVIHEWVRQDYTLDYWQMNGHFSQLFAIYQCMELNPYSHSFVGLLHSARNVDLTPVLTPGPSPQSGEGGMVCQFDVYSVFADELREHITVEPHDCGFHLLMAPNKKPIPGLTTCVVKAFLNYYFSFSQAQRMYAEPDVNNEKSIALLERVGFKRIKTVRMSYKEAHVYCLERPHADPSGVPPSQ